MKKLVRDKLPLEIANDRPIKLTALVGPLAESSLIEKLHEETQEVNEAYYGGGNLDAVMEELADVVEVCIALANRLGFTENQLKEKRISKRVNKGGFDKAYFVNDEL